MSPSVLPDIMWTILYNQILCEQYQIIRYENLITAGLKLYTNSEKNRNKPSGDNKLCLSATPKFVSFSLLNS